MITDKTRIHIFRDFARDDYKLIIRKYENGKRYDAELIWKETYLGCEGVVAAIFDEEEILKVFEELQSSLRVKLQITSDKESNAQKEHIASLQKVIDYTLGKGTKK